MALSLLMSVAGLMAKERLTVLYVGGSPQFSTYGEFTKEQLKKSAEERTADFAKFLRQRFTKVNVVSARDYKPEMSAAADVTVFDAIPPYTRKAERVMGADGKVKSVIPPACLPDDFSCAALCIADASNRVGRSLGTKNDWYCLCLRNYAYNSDLSHAVFQGPWKVTPTMENREVPFEARDYGAVTGGTVPERIDMWKVYDPKKMEGLSTRFGLICRPEGYLDSPDTEVISSGESGKSFESVAIARHGNFFHWGFCGAPSEMTPSGRDLFANSIVYTSKFKGHPVIARKYEEAIVTRDFLPLIKYSNSKEAWRYQAKADLDFYNETVEKLKELKARVAAGEELPEEAMRYASAPLPEKPAETTYADYLMMREPQLFKVFGDDEEEYMRYYDRNRPYFRAGDMIYNLVVDKEARSLGIPNNDVRILDKAISLLEEGGEKSKIGDTILKRYTLCRFQTPKEWREWYDKNHDKLFFTESGGWLWLLNTDNPNDPTNDYSVLSRE